MSKSLLIAIIFLSACSHQGTYESLQRQQAAKCDRAVTQDQREACNNEALPSYDDYHRERQAILNRPNA